jgi:rRNA maturation endonuclease Nob1
MHNTEVTVCYECDQEFSVQSTYEEEQPIAFCPYCGNELNVEDDEDEDLDDDSDEDAYKDWTN